MKTSKLVSKKMTDSILNILTFIFSIAALLAVLIRFIFHFISADDVMLLLFVAVTLRVATSIINSRSAK